jgi:hypothetical protein
VSKVGVETTLLLTRRTMQRSASDSMALFTAAAAARSHESELTPTVSISLQRLIPYPRFSFRPERRYLNGRFVLGLRSSA